MSTGLARSVHVRLVRHAKALNLDPNHVFTRYATERLLYRLSTSPHQGRFVLKGGLLLLAWLGEAFRPTRDIDLLGFGELDGVSLARAFAEVCSVDVEPDGLVYETESIRVVAIRREEPYGGQRVTLQARLGKARIRIQVDVGIGDAVTPEPVWLKYPSLLDLPRPRLRAYRPETTIAEKVHAMVELGRRNSRMRDFFDVHALAMHFPFEGRILGLAVRDTFERRGTAIPAGAPLALTPAFVEIEGKRAQWAAFLRRSRLTTAPADMEVVIDAVAEFVGPVLRAVAQGKRTMRRWPVGGPWT